MCEWIRRDMGGEGGGVGVGDTGSAFDARDVNTKKKWKEWIVSELICESNGEDSCFFLCTAYAYENIAKTTRRNRFSILLSCTRKLRIKKIPYDARLLRKMRYTKSHLQSSSSSTFKWPRCRATAAPSIQRTRTLCTCVVLILIII